MHTDDDTKITVEQFLNQLPMSTIANDGRIMSIRNSIRNIIENKPTTVNIGTHREPIDSSADQPGPHAQIKIRSLNGDKVHQISMKPFEFVKDLYEKLSQMINVSANSFVLVSAFPPTRKLTDMNMTVEGAGLTPNASLCMRLVN